MRKLQVILKRFGKSRLENSYHFPSSMKEEPDINNELISSKKGTTGNGVGKGSDNHKLAVLVLAG